MEIIRLIVPLQRVAIKRMLGAQVHTLVRVIILLLVRLMGVLSKHILMEPIAHLSVTAAIILLTVMI